LSLKAGEMFSLQTDAEFKVREDEKEKNQIENAKNGIKEGFDNLTIHKITKLSIEKIEQLRRETKI